MYGLDTATIKIAAAKPVSQMDISPVFQMDISLVSQMDISLVSQMDISPVSQMDISLQMFVSCAFPVSGPGQTGYGPGQTGCGPGLHGFPLLTVNGSPGGLQWITG